MHEYPCFFHFWVILLLPIRCACIFCFQLHDATHHTMKQDTKQTLRETPEWIALFKELIRIQNSGKHEHQDIITITGFMQSIDELKEHVRRNS